MRWVEATIEVAAAGRAGLARKEDDRLEVTPDDLRSLVDDSPPRLAGRLPLSADVFGLRSAGRTTADAEADDHFLYKPTVRDRKSAWLRATKSSGLSL